jgi:hypothetical protein
MKSSRHKPRTRSPARPGLMLTAPPPAGCVPFTHGLRLRIRQAPTPESGIQLPDGTAHIRTHHRRHPIKNELQRITRFDRIAARTVRPRELQPFRRLANELSVAQEVIANCRRQPQAGLKASSHRVGSLAELRSLDSGSLGGGAERARRPTRHRPFWSLSQGDARTPSADASSPELGQLRPGHIPLVHRSGEVQISTAQFKIKVVGDELKRRGATAQHPATVGIGISVDEIGPANKRRCEPHERIEYPLLVLGIRRADCPRIIRSAGLPVPPKSSCWFCPFHRPGTWHEMRRTEPELFRRACQLEDHLNRTRDTLGKDHVYLTRFAKPLREAIPDGVDTFFEPDDTDPGCDSGWCMT